eukprot:TRINITY_DN5034_c0_g1_i1.p3 TRINITY_DN5034_c0_g1~~TRINITY_DN5034_c0_g1_i1.p3  ORF type:complete len:168 (+),score=47.81 TRINITY_DN5034_c0_g1_i1:1625-2128(+)
MTWRESLAPKPVPQSLNFGVLLATLLTADAYASARVLSRFWSFTAKGQQIEKKAINELYLGSDVKTVAIVWALKVAVEDIPQLVIQSLTTNMLDKSSPITILSLSATTLSIFIGSFSFLIFTVVPIVAKQRGPTSLEMSDTAAALKIAELTQQNLLLQQQIRQLEGK